MPIKIIKAANLLLIVVLSFFIIIYAKPFLVPVTFAALLAMLMLPITKWLDQKGFNNALASLASVLITVLVITGVILFIQWQIGNIIEDADKIEKEFSAKFEDIRTFLSRRFGISLEQQNKFLKEHGGSAGKQAGSIIATTLGTLGSFITNLLLVLIYMFLFLYYRKRIRKFFLSLLPDEAFNTDVVLNKAQKISQRYVGGMSLMIMGLWIMYGIGFSIAGVENPIFYAVLCGILEIVPFIGNLTGTAITVLMVIARGGDTGIIVGVVITYAVVQFVQSYLVEPLVVGKGVRINPMMTIIALVAGEFVWGIAGMVLALPLTAIIKIVFDHVKGLKPLGDVMGEEKETGS